MSAVDSYSLQCMWKQCINGVAQLIPEGLYRLIYLNNLQVNTSVQIIKAASTDGCIPVQIRRTDKVIEVGILNEQGEVLYREVIGVQVY